MNMPHVPDQFMKLAALMESTTFPAECETARRKAEALLTPEMGGFDRALRIATYQRVRAANPMNIMAGFSEFLEIDDPGYMDREAAKRAQRLEAWHRRRADLVEQYGTLEAVEAPCEREQAILAAVEPWRIASEPPHQRWTRGFKGWESPYNLEDMPAPLRAAVEGAISMPGTYVEARAELAYWRQRNDDLEHAMGENGVFPGDYGLDFSAETRMHLIRELVDHGMRLTTLSEIVDRFALHRKQGSDDEKVETALFRDLCVLVGREVEPEPLKQNTATACTSTASACTAPATASTAPKPASAQKPKREPSPWPTWSTLSHFSRLTVFDELKKGRQFTGEEAELFAKFHEVYYQHQCGANRKAINLFNRGCRELYERGFRWKDAA